VAQRQQVRLAVWTTLSTRDDVMRIRGGDDLTGMVAIGIHTDGMSCEKHLA
jgi:hypothetical protein